MADAKYRIWKYVHELSIYLIGPKDIGIAPTEDQGTVSGRFF